MPARGGGIQCGVERRPVVGVGAGDELAEGEIIELERVREALAPSAEVGDESLERVRRRAGGGHQRRAARRGHQERGEEEQGGEAHGRHGFLSGGRQPPEAVHRLGQAGRRDDRLGGLTPPAQKSRRSPTPARTTPPPRRPGARSPPSSAYCHAGGPVWSCARTRGSRRSGPLNDLGGGGAAGAVGLRAARDAGCSANLARVSRNKSASESPPDSSADAVVVVGGGLVQQRRAGLGALWRARPALQRRPRAARRG